MWSLILGSVFELKASKLSTPRLNLDFQVAPRFVNRMTIEWAAVGNLRGDWGGFIDGKYMGHNQTTMIDISYVDWGPPR